MQIHKKELIAIAKNLRKNLTPWEEKLWYYLRGSRLLGLKFKRQVMLGEYIVDFCCNEEKLIIEIDGGQHNEAGNLSHDEKRTKYFNRYGYRVLRFWNNEIEENIEGVLERIRLSLIARGSTSPLPSPGLERG